MRRILSRLPRPSAGVLLAAVVGVSLLAPAAGAASPGLGGVHAHRRVCTTAPAGSASCHAEVVVDGNGAPLATSTFTSGYDPAALQSAYALPGIAAGAGQTVAIVDANDDPSAEADLAVYRNRFGLAACTTANGCFRKVNQTGGTRYPRANGSWAQEISLDLDMVSATCPSCHILLVEASSASFANLGTAVNTAAGLHASSISNSYGGSEFPSETSYEAYYTHPGVAVTVSSGDAGYGTQYPAASRYVTAVGGTSLTHASGAWTETAWSGAGSGCSAYIAKPSFQHDSGCARRSVADVSAVADPNTGVAVYDSYAYGGSKGWMVFGGTSVAAPIVASVYALAGVGNRVAISDASLPYNNAQTGGLTDVMSGHNGACSVTYLCTAGPGYDGPTGLGTPHGIGAF